MTAGRTVAMGELVVTALVRQRVAGICHCPGARNTPFALALSPEAKVFVDERAAGFFALGWGRAVGRPAAVFTTSGSAVANLHPAVVEADRGRVPLLVITADRPAELRDTGSNQVIAQSGIFGASVRWSADLALSDPDVPAQALLSTVAHAVEVAVRDRGPVHLNLQLREPLGPAEPEPDAPRVARWRADLAPWCEVAAGLPAWTKHADALLARWMAAPKGLVVVGDLPRSRVDAVAALVTALGWPVHADPLSGLRCRPGLAPRALGLDAALADPVLAERFVPDAVLWIGGPVVSKRVVTWIGTHAVPVLHLDETAVRIDPAFAVRARIVAGLDAAAAAVRAAGIDPLWVEAWRQLDSATRTAIAGLPEGADELHATRAVVASSEALLVGSSLPIRHVELVAPPDHGLVLGANRGASGIDGTLATAAGWATGLGSPLRVLLGDLTALHDVGSLALLADASVQAVVLNNGGGAIFAGMPMAQAPRFDEVFFAGHDRRLAPLAAAMGLRATTASPHELAAALEEGFSLIEVVTHARATVAATHVVQQAIVDGVKGALA